MPQRTLVRPGVYQDSVALMRLASELSDLDDVVNASAVMATESNKELMDEAGLLTSEAESASANDLVVVVDGKTKESLERAVEHAEDILLQGQEIPQGERGEAEPRPRTIASAVRAMPHANIVLVSTPGMYAAAEALKGLKAGLHVFLFSDNVPVEQEVLLKDTARRRGLLVMGPDCGTALVAGVGLGFANAVGTGPIGVVGPSGTGLQAVTALVDRLGSGISHAIGAGSRDLSDAVGGVTTHQGLEALSSDARTDLVILVSKPPSPHVAADVLAACGELGKPAVVNFLGLDPAGLDAPPNVTLTRTIGDAARLGVSRVTGTEPTPSAPDDTIAEALDTARAALGSEQRYIRGLFSGGTLCTETLVVLHDAGVNVRSNIPLTPELRLADPLKSEGHACVDMGTDEFTVGRPHPMIDFRSRVNRLVEEARDPTVAVILLDVVLGFGAHPDPAGELVPAIRQARDEAASGDREIVVMASVCGTEGDPQGLQRQEDALREAGVIVLSTSAQAALTASSALDTKTRR